MFVSTIEDGQCSSPGAPRLGAVTVGSENSHAHGAETRRNIEKIVMGMGHQRHVGIAVNISERGLVSPGAHAQKRIVANELQSPIPHVESILLCRICISPCGFVVGVKMIVELVNGRRDTVTDDGGKHHQTRYQQTDASGFKQFFAFEERVADKWRQKNEGHITGPALKDHEMEEI